MHCASAVDVEVACIKTSLKRESDVTLEVLSTIINGCIENNSQAAQGSLPNSHALKNRTKKAQSTVINCAEAAQIKLYAELGSHH